MASPARMLVTCAAFRSRFQGDRHEKKCLIAHCDARSAARARHPGGLQPREDRLEIGRSRGHRGSATIISSSAIRTARSPRRRVTRVAQLNEDRDWKKPPQRTRRMRIGSSSRSTRAGSGRKRRAFASKISRSMARRRDRRSLRADCSRGCGSRCSGRRSPAHDAPPTQRASVAASAPAGGAGETVPSRLRNPPPSPSRRERHDSRRCGQACRRRACGQRRLLLGIQLGAFRSPDAALKNWKQLQTEVRRGFARPVRARRPGKANRLVSSSGCRRRWATSRAPGRSARP